MFCDASDSGNLQSCCLMHQTVCCCVVSLWGQAQQSGRCGRGRDQPEALSIIVCFDSPVDQYYALHPRELFARGTEPTSLRTNNPYVLRAHLLCAAYEVPLRDFDRPSPALQGGGFSEEALWGGGYQQALDYLLCSPLPQPIPAPSADGSPIAGLVKLSLMISIKDLSIRVLSQFISLEWLCRVVVSQTQRGEAQSFAWVPCRPAVMNMPS